jgi:hypothetical protein
VGVSSCPHAAAAPCAARASTPRRPAVGARPPGPCLPQQCAPLRRLPSSPPSSYTSVRYYSPWIQRQLALGQLYAYQRANPGLAPAPNGTNSSAAAAAAPPPASVFRLAAAEAVPAGASAAPAEGLAGAPADGPAATGSAAPAPAEAAAAAPQASAGAGLQFVDLGGGGF